MGIFKRPKPKTIQLGYLKADSIVKFPQGVFKVYFDLDESIYDIVERLNDEAGKPHDYSKPNIDLLIDYLIDEHYIAKIEKFDPKEFVFNNNFQWLDKVCPLPSDIKDLQDLINDSDRFRLLNSIQVAVFADNIDTSMSGDTLSARLSCIIADKVFVRRCAKVCSTLCDIIDIDESQLDGKRDPIP